MVISSRQRIATLGGNISLRVNGLTLQQVETTKYRGQTIDQFLILLGEIILFTSFSGHRPAQRKCARTGLRSQSVRQKVGCGILILKRIRPLVALEHHINVYSSAVEPYFTYCCIVWDSVGETLAGSLQKLQNGAAHVITGASCSKHSADFRHELSWLSLRL